MTKVFIHAESEMLKDKSLKEKKLYFLNKWIDETQKEIEKLIGEGLSPYGPIVNCLEKLIIKYTKLRGEVLKC